SGGNPGEPPHPHRAGLRRSLQPAGHSLLPPRPVRRQRRRLSAGPQSQPVTFRSPLGPNSVPDPAQPPRRSPEVSAPGLGTPALSGWAPRGHQAARGPNRTRGIAVTDEKPRGQPAGAGALARDSEPRRSPDPRGESGRETGSPARTSQTPVRGATEPRR